MVYTVLFTQHTVAMMRLERGSGGVLRLQSVAYILWPFSPTGA